jgi:hypothetical protein
VSCGRRFISLCWIRGRLKEGGGALNLIGGYAAKTPQGVVSDFSVQIGLFAST